MNRPAAIGISVAALAVLIAIIGGGWWIKLNFFEAGAYVVTESADVDYATRLKVRGTDLRVYEFTPQSAPHMTCAFVAGENKGDMEC